LKETAFARSRSYFFAGVVVDVAAGLVSGFFVFVSSEHPRIDKVKQRANSIAASFFIDVFLYLFDDVVRARSGGGGANGL
jgi:hypothetical protein